jgi:lipoyl(octanoyl) transferase
VTQTLAPPIAPARTAAGPASVASTGHLSWRVLRDRARSGAANMALDHALARCLGPDEAVLRLYSWERPTVSFGRNEPARERYRATAARRPDVGWVRRPTGGRAVVHDAELTYMVVAPLRALGGARSAYRSINDAIARALAALGAGVEVAAHGDTLPLRAGPCFQSPAAGEVIAAGKKLVGSAQARIDGALLQHGSILLSGDQSLLGERARSGVTLRDLVGPVAPADVANRVVEAMGAAFGGEWVEAADVDERERAEAERLERERYATDEWTWRR